MTSVLVVINKKKEQAFRASYITFLSEHNRNDFDNWKKRQENIIKSQHGLIENVEEQRELVERDLNKAIKEYEQKMDQPGGVPFSDEKLSISDQDGNMLYTIVCMTDQAQDYVKVLKKNGYPS